MKIIKMSVLSKIKKCKLRIFEAEDDDIPNMRIVRRNERIIDDLIKDYTKEEQEELWENIKWHNDDCTSKLEQLGWKVIKGE